MGDPMDIHAVLQNGYFKTSRAKSPQPDQSPSASPPKSSSRLGDYRQRNTPEFLRPQFRPPPPTVEDEAEEVDALGRERNTPGPHCPQIRPPPPTVEDEVDALAKEYGALSVGSVPAEVEVQSPGEPDQFPLIMEVHEHNPERRFVLVPGAAEQSQSKSKDDNSDADKDKGGRSGDERPERSPSGRRYEPVFDDTLDLPRERPATVRRRSRQDLPRIETDMRRERSPEHYRTRSAVGPRPDGWSGRPPASARDDMLSPDMIKQGSGRREKRYYGSDTPTSAPRRLGHQRSSSNLGDDRRRDTPQRRESISPAYSARSESNPDGRRPRRRLSTERGSEFRYRDEPARHSRRESNVPYKRDGDAPKSPSVPRPMGPRPCKDDSRPGDEALPTSRGPGRRRGNSASVHQDAEPIPIPSPGREMGVWPEDRVRRRAPSIPPQAPPILASSLPNEASVHPRASATFPIISGEYQAHLPYPDDVPTSRSGRSPIRAAQGHPSASMPDMPAPSSVSPERGFDNPQTGTPATAKTTAWPPPFDPERDGVAPDQEIGSYRRYSEGRGTNAVPKFVECQRKEPVVGLMDWLTLPHTDLNICPGCYQGVFSHTEYRTHFQPMLRPTDRPIICDFGSSPWYRIAWLLTLKNEYPDLRLFRQVDSVAVASRNQPCPGSRKALRNWFMIRDPYKRRAVPNFTVCYQCAKTVEALLPNLMGTFVPMDSRPEPLSSVCALHFKPERRRFALYFDTLEITADKAVKYTEPPDVSALASKIEHLSAVPECREDSPIPEARWHTMQYLPEFTVCADCFDEVVRPLLGSNIIARNFYKDPQRVPLATCQLYSERMREIFGKACRRNDPKYLRAKVLERLQVEADIHSQLVKLDKEGHDEAWTEEQVGKLIREWKKWE